MLRIAQGAAELAATRLKQSSPFIRPNLRCSASHKGPGKRHGTTSGSLFQTLFRVSSLGVRRFSPSRRQRRATEGFAEIARGLSEARRAEFRSAREDRVAQGTLRSRALTPGRLFFAYFLLAKQKKVRRTASAKPHRRTSAKPKYRGLSPVSPRFPPQNPAIESADQPRPRRDSAGLNAPHPPPPTSSASAASPRPPGRQSPESTLP